MSKNAPGRKHIDGTPNPAFSPRAIASARACIPRPSRVLTTSFIVVPMPHPSQYLSLIRDARSSRQSVCARQRCYSAHSRLPQQELGAVRRCSVLMGSIGGISHDGHVHRLIDAYAHLFARALIDEVTGSLEKPPPGSFNHVHLAERLQPIDRKSTRLNSSH